jgi:hypothetical protein
MTDLTDIETRHGFTFGIPEGTDTPKGDLAGFAVCVHPTCTLRGQHFQYHRDTTLPIHCGGCGRVLVEHPDAGAHVDHSKGDGPDIDALVEAVTNRLKAKK